MILLMGGVIADKVPWCKFWHSCLSDPDLEELELHQWARWARLIIFVRGHGDNGKMRLEPPARALQNTLRVPSYEELIKVIKLFKNVSLAVTGNGTSHDTSHDPLQSYFMNVKNWYKYQGDDSKERMRKWRVTRPVTKSVKSNALDKTRLDVTSTSTSSARDASLAASPRSHPLKSFEEFQKSIPESERMTPEEMKAIRLKAFGKTK